ncbi:hypothetical protein D3874_00635 [Oleomonas cavernae]|uniref:SRPBCC family protein n=1 Tax=Oleomonas cavernae TaxID=2320859 RepID=A0A418WSZ7_9PROT|nr:hypothetical protein [Oleomonas cavernae]RJF94392.1 hypothetical protein D3874_00635 [Oleomonas cavernae]
MAISVDIKRQNRETVPAAFERVVALLEDVEATLAHFPSLRSFEPLGDSVYHWRLAPLGPVTHKTRIDFATRFSIDKVAGVVEFKPVPKIGNASIGGRIEIKAKAASHSDIAINVAGKVEVPVSWLLKAVATPIVMREFNGLVDGFVANLKNNYL